MPMYISCDWIYSHKFVFISPNIILNIQCGLAVRLYLYSLFSHFILNIRWSKCKNHPVIHFKTLLIQPNIEQTFFWTVAFSELALCIYTYFEQIFDLFLFVCLLFYHQLQRQHICRIFDMLWTYVECFAISYVLIWNLNNLSVYSREFWKKKSDFYASGWFFEDRFYDLTQQKL